MALTQAERQKFDDLIETVAKIEISVLNLVKLVEGNGKKGLDARVLEVEANVAQLLKESCKDNETKEQKAKGKRDFWMKLWLLAIGVIFSNIGTIVMTFLLLRWGLTKQP